MSFPRNLIPGQYQIGDLIFGRGTTVRVEVYDPKPYDVAAQDYQVVRADEVRFGWDQLKPTTIEITFHILKNRLRPEYANLIPNFWKEQPKLSDFKREWRSDEIRYQWGAMKPLWVCGPDGITRTVYGRPGKFTHGDDGEFVESIQCLAEFRCADTLAYGIVDKTGGIMSQASPTITINGTAGDGPSWLHCFIKGPVVNPKVTFTGLYDYGTLPCEFTLNRTVAAGEIIELDGEPWSRRAINSLGENVAADLTAYLDKLRFKHDSTVTATLSGTGMTGATAAWLGYKDAYQVAKE